MILLIIFIPLIIAALLFIRESYRMNETYKAMFENHREIEELKFKTKILENETNVNKIRSIENNRHL